MPPLPPFPNLQKPNVTSPYNERYNCIAWAFSDNAKWWWPRRAYWPRTVDVGATILRAFEEQFAAEGWVEAGDSALEAGFVKIALYANSGNITHAARQLDTGVWTSKLGKHVDLAHDLSELEGPQYGTLFRIYKKQV